MSTIAYSDWPEMDNSLSPMEYYIQRHYEGYVLRSTFDKWSLLLLIFPASVFLGAFLLWYFPSPDCTGWFAHINTFIQVIVFIYKWSSTIAALPILVFVLLLILPHKIYIEPEE